MEKIENRNILNLQNRKQIYGYIYKFPGIHLSELVRKIKISEKIVRYHIKVLSKMELIFIKRIIPLALYCLNIFFLYFFCRDASVYSSFFQNLIFYNNCTGCNFNIIFNNSPWHNKYSCTDNYIVSNLYTI